MSKNTQRINVETLKSSLSPFDFYSHELDGVIFKKHGWNDGGLCPFHSDNSKGSFRVNLTSGAYKCYSCGESGGDIVSFTMASHALSFNEALNKLAYEWGMS